ncbi:MAG TPA: efflux RND transporter periplasmic adaptor subunit [Devosiaceae bacterium]|jgi:multidrug efflux system membrane fusion protein
MRALFSYGVAAILVLIAAIWLGTGSLIQGGQGPGKGERQIVSLVEGKEDGPVKTALQNSGVLATPVKEETVDPHLTIAQRQEETGSGGTAVRAVSVKTYTAEAMPINVPLRGQTEAKAIVTASSETTGIVAKVSVVKGQTVKTGDLLCTLDQGTRQAAVEQAQAALAQAQTESDSTEALVKRGVAASNTTAAAQAGLKSAQAALDVANEELKRTEIRAKSDGVIQDPLVTVGSMLAAGQPCATVVQLDPILFTGAVPEAKIAYAKLGLPATVTTVTGQTLEGKVSFIASVADNATRTFQAQIEMPNPGNAVPAGLTATATINVGTAPAQLLPQSVLTLDDEGVMGVRGVEDSKVVFYPVTIVNDAREGMYVTGLPAKADVITVGQEFVKAGDTVKAVPDTGETDDGKQAANNGAQQ